MFVIQQENEKTWSTPAYNKLNVYDEQSVFVHKVIKHKRIDVVHFVVPQPLGNDYEGRTATIPGEAEFELCLQWPSYLAQLQQPWIPKDIVHFLA